jgi:hypothetical protein
MGLGTNHQDSTTLATLIPEIWGERINEFYWQDLVMAPFFIDRSMELEDGGDILHTPTMVEMASNTKTNGSEVTLNKPTELSADLTVTTWKEVSFIIEDREASTMKKSYNVAEVQMLGASRTVSTDLEGAIAALFDNFSTSVGASTATLSDPNIRSAIATLEANTKSPVNPSDTAFFVSNGVFWNQIQGLDRFALATNAPVNDPVGKVPEGYLYGIPVFRTANIPYVSSTTGRYNCLAKKDAIHWAARSFEVQAEYGMVGAHNVRIQSSYVHEYLGTLVTADICYGVVMNRSTAGVTIITSA